MGDKYEIPQHASEAEEQAIRRRQLPGHESQTQTYLALLRIERLLARLVSIAEAPKPSPRGRPKKSAK